MFWGSNYYQLLTFITIIELIIDNYLQIIGPARRRRKKIAIFGVQFRYFPLSRFELYRVIRSNHQLLQVIWSNCNYAADQLSSRFELYRVIRSNHQLLQVIRSNCNYAEDQLSSRLELQ